MDESRADLTPFYNDPFLQRPKALNMESVMKTKDLVAEVTSLPIEERTIVADLILKSLNPTDTVIDQIWVNIAKRRVQEIRAGKVKLVLGDEVFKKIQERFQR